MIARLLSSNDTVRGFALVRALCVLVSGTAPQVTVAYQKDPSPLKVNLGVGAYRTEVSSPFWCKQIHFIVPLCGCKETTLSCCCTRRLQGKREDDSDRGSAWLFPCFSSRKASHWCLKW